MFKLIAELNLILIQASSEAWPVLDQLRPFYEQYHGKYIVQGLAVVFVFFVLSIMGKIISSSSANSVSVGSAPISKSKAAQINKTAQRMAQDGDLIGAAEQYRIAGNLEETAKCYVRARNPLKAAETFMEMKKPDRAADMYIKADRPEMAADLYKKFRDYKKAGETYLKAKNHTMAAEMFEFSGDLVQAAQCHEKGQNYRKAGELYGKTDQLEKAAANLMKAFLQLQSRLRMTNVNEKEKQDITDLAFRSGVLFSKIGKTDKAIETLSNAELYDKAAEVAERAGMLEQAAELYHKGRFIDQAAACYEKLGETSRAKKLRAEALSESGDEAAAAEAYAQAGDYLEAAERYRMIEEYFKAAENYEKLGDFTNAADMFRKGKDLKRAADMLIKAKDYNSAAAIYMNMGDFAMQSQALAQGGFLFEAGKNYFMHQDFNKAVDTLQKIEEKHPHYRAACSLLGDIFKEKGMLALAIQKYQQAIDGQEVNKSNFHPYYHLALVLESQGNLKIAQAIYKSILTYDYQYSDVSARFDAIQKTLAEQAPTAPAEDTSDITPPKPKKKDSRYTILDEIGRGGMGIVYKAKENLLDRFVAYKVLQTNLEENDLAVRNFLREAKSAAALNHPNIVTVYDTGEEDGTYYIAMEFISGQTLRQILRAQRKPLDLDLFFEVSMQLCEALDYAHRLGVIHRDIKASNIMWDDDFRRVKIMDFGLAKVIQEVVNYQTVVGGTPHYMSPEQILGEATDHRSDLYSLAVTFYEILVGQVPFKKGDVGYHHIHTPPPLAHERRSELPLELSQVIVKGMAKDKNERYQTAGEMGKDIKEIRDNLKK
jgi:eukaryotic-like serine/threonine-protein kinase